MPNLYIFTDDSQLDNMFQKRKLARRSNSDSDISYYYTHQKYNETDTVFNITGM